MEGEIRSVPAVALRAAATFSVTFLAGRWPPSPGFAPWPILISTRNDELTISLVTPKRPEATCWPRQSGYFPYMSRISPPSPFIATMLIRLAASA